MEGERILKCLKEENFDNFSQSIQTYLDTCLKTYDVAKDPSKFSNFLCKLFKSVGIFLCGKQPNNSQIEDVTDATIYCCNLVDSKVLELRGLQFVNPLYHIIVNLLQNKYHTRAISLADFLYRHLQKNKCGWNEDNQVSTVVKNIYISFWNFAIDIESETISNKVEFCLNFHSIALKYLAFDNKFGHFSDKVGRAIQWYMNKAEVQSDLKEIKEFLHLMWDVFKNSLSTETAVCEKIRIFIEACKDWTKHILLCSQYKHLLEEVTMFLRDISILASSDSDIRDIVKVCVDATNFIVNLLKSTERVNENKNILKMCSFLQKTVKVYSEESTEFFIVSSFLSMINCILSELYKLVYTQIESHQDLPIVYMLLETDSFLKIQASILFNQKSPPDNQVQNFITLFCSLINLLKVMRSTLSQVKQDENQVRTLAEKTHALCSYISSQELATEHSTYIQLNEYRNLGNEIGNLGIILFNSGVYKDAILFLQLSIDYFSRSTSNSLISDTIRQQNQLYLWKKHELVATSFLMTNKFEEALKAIIMGLKWDKSKLTAAMKIWVKVKIEAQRSKQSIVCRTIRQVLNDCGMSVDTTELISLLQAELQSYKLERVYLKDAVYSAASSLLDLPTNDIVKACALIEVAFAMWHSGHSKVSMQNTRSAVECCKEAVSLLENNNIISDNLEIKVYLSVANFWLYQTQLKELQQTSKEEVHRAPSVSNDDNSDENYSPKTEEDKNDRCDIVPAYSSVKLQVEMQALEPLIKALKLWLETFKNSGVKWNHLVPLVQELNLMELMKAAGEIFTSTENVVNELKTWNVLRDVAQAVGSNAMELHAMSCLILRLSRLHLLKAAEFIIEDATKIVKAADETDHTFQIAKLKYHLSKCEYFFWNEKFDLGVELLCEVLKNPLLERNTKSSILLNCEAKMMAASYLLLPPAAMHTNSMNAIFNGNEYSLGDYPSSFTSSNSPICLVLNSMKMCIALIKHFDSEYSSKSCSDDGSLSFKPALTRILLESSIMVGKLYSDIGAPREARCYLREHLTVAQELLLAYRSAEFLVALAHLDLLCDNSEDCRVKLNGLQYMLHVSEKPEKLNFGTCLEDTQPTIGNPPTEEEIVDDFMSVKPGRSLKGHIQKKLLQNSNIQFSPECKRKKRINFPTLNHSSFCTCATCEHLSIHSLYLQVMILEYQSQNASDQSYEDITQFQKQLALLEEKWKTSLVTLLPDIIKQGKNKKAAKLVDGNKAVNLCHLVLNVKIYSSLASLAFRKLQYQTALQNISQAMVYLKQISKSPEHLHYLHFATIVYQKVVISLQILLSQYTVPNLFNSFWTSNSNSLLKDSYDVSEIEDNFSKMSISHLTSLPENSISKTPHSKKGLKPLLSDGTFPRGCRAPHKKVLSSTMKSYVDSLSESKIPKQVPWSPLFTEYSGPDEVSLADENTPANSQIQAVKCKDKASVKTKNIKKRNVKARAQKTKPISHDITVSDDQTSSVKYEKQNMAKTSLSDAFPSSNSTNSDSSPSYFSSVNLDILPCENPVGIKSGRGKNTLCFKETCKRGKSLRHNVPIETERDLQDGHTSYTDMTPQVKVKATGDLCKSYSRKTRCRKTLKSHDTFDNLTSDTIEIFRTRSKPHQPKKPTKALQKAFEIAEDDLQTDLSSRCSSEKEAARNSIALSSVSGSICTPHFSTNALNEPYFNFNVFSSKLEDSVFSEDAETTLETIYNELKEAMLIVSHHPPCPLYPNICTLLAILEGFKHAQRHKKENKELDKMKSAFYFSESVAVTLRHQTLIRIIKNKSKLGKCHDLNSLQKIDSHHNISQDLCDISGGDIMRHKICSFKVQQETEVQQMKHMLQILPEEWTVVQVCGFSSHLSLNCSNKHVAPDLLVCRYQKNCVPIMTVLNSSKDNQFSNNFLVEFRKILEESKATMLKKDPKVWWTVRKSLDVRLKELTESMENVWLGCWKGLFLGIPEDPQSVLHLRAVSVKILLQASELGFTCENSDLLQILVDSSRYLTKEQLATAVSHLWNISPNHPSHKSICQMLQDSSHSVKIEKRHPVILILDKSVQALPWESMPLIRNHPISRVPSLNLLCTQLMFYNKNTDSIFNNGINGSNTFYVLNPSNDLKDTQQKFEAIFKQEEGWTGVIGRPPTLQEFSSALGDHDLFLYCGHGTGREYLSGESVERLKCQAATILMGCSSGQLKVFSHLLEPTGVVLQYFLGGSPCVVGNLWDVTDKDIDRFTLAMLQNWFPYFNGSSLGQPNMQIGDAISMARNKCKLPYLIGSAPVIYGLPVRIQHKPSSN